MTFVFIIKCELVLFVNADDTELKMLNKTFFVWIHI